MVDLELGEIEEEEGELIEVDEGNESGEIEETPMEDNRRQIQQPDRSRLDHNGSRSSYESKHFKRHNSDQDRSRGPPHAPRMAFDSRRGPPQRDRLRRYDDPDPPPPQKGSGMDAQDRLRGGHVSARPPVARGSDDREKEDILASLHAFKPTSVAEVMKADGLDPACDNIKPQIKLLDRLLSLIKRKNDSIEDHPEAYKHSLKIMEALKSINIVCGTSIGFTRNVDSAKSLFKMAHNYRHDIFTSSQKTEFEGLISSSKVFKVILGPDERERGPRVQRGGQGMPPDPPSSRPNTNPNKDQSKGLPSRDIPSPHVSEPDPEPSAPPAQPSSGLAPQDPLPPPPPPPPPVDPSPPLPPHPSSQPSAPSSSRHNAPYMMTSTRGGPASSSKAIGGTPGGGFKFKIVVASTEQDIKKTSDHESLSLEDPFSFRRRNPSPPPNGQGGRGGYGGGGGQAEGGSGSGREYFSKRFQLASPPHLPPVASGQAQGQMKRPPSPSKDPSLNPHPSEAKRSRWAPPSQTPPVPYDPHSEDREDAERERGPDYDPRAHPPSPLTRSGSDDDDMGGPGGVGGFRWERERERDERDDAPRPSRPPYPPEPPRPSSPPRPSRPPLHPISDPPSLLKRNRALLLISLDHTLVDSIPISQVDEEMRRLLAHRMEAEDRAVAAGIMSFPELYRLDRLGSWVKLRPGVRDFLRHAHEAYELCLYTKCSRGYADGLMDLLDPRGYYFGDRVVSLGGEAGEGLKREGERARALVEGGREALSVVLDEGNVSWPRDERNIVGVERYPYFSPPQASGPSLFLLDQNRDECIERGMLPTISSLLDRVHSILYSCYHEPAHLLPGLVHLDASLEPWDVRNVIEGERRRVLGDCSLVFSRVIASDCDPRGHPLWKMAEKFGARCSMRCSEETTHVIANTRGTEKTFWAAQNSRFIVTPAWLECSCMLWSRAREDRFDVLL